MQSTNRCAGIPVTVILCRRKGPFKCYVTLFFGKLDPHPPPRNANNIEHNTFVTFFPENLTPHPHRRYVTLEWPLMCTTLNGKRSSKLVELESVRQSDSSRLSLHVLFGHSYPNFKLDGAASTVEHVIIILWCIDLLYFNLWLYLWILSSVWIDRLTVVFVAFDKLQFFTWGAIQVLCNTFLWKFDGPSPIKLRNIFFLKFDSAPPPHPLHYVTLVCPLTQLFVCFIVLEAPNV